MSKFNSFLAAMDGAASGENGLPGVTTRGMAASMQSRGERGGALVGASTALVRGCANVEQLMCDILRETVGFSEAEKAAQLEDAFVLTVQTRDCRGGKGEKKLFYQMLLALEREGFQDIVLRLLPLIPNVYGSWKDVVDLYGLAAGFTMEDAANPATRTRMYGRNHRRRSRNEKVKVVQKTRPKITGLRRQALMDACLELMATQLKEDYEKLVARSEMDEDSKAQENSEEAKPVNISLAAKWAPREKRAADGFSRVARDLALKLFPIEGEGEWTAPDKAAAKRKYRKLVAALNAHLKTVEVSMSARDWDNVDPAAVPSRAMNLYRYALRNTTKEGEVRSDDPARERLAERVKELAAATRANPQGAKTLKGKQLFPYEIVRNFMGYHRSEDPVLEAQWAVQEAALLELAHNGSMLNGICLCDVSGSMSGVPMENSIALGILLSRSLPEPWKGRVLTFESKPQWHQLPTHKGATIQEMVQSLASAPWGGSTDFGAALRVILDTAKAHKVPSEDMPEVLYVFTDMQFDQASLGRSSRLAGFDTATKRLAGMYKAAGYEMPHILFWNLRANTCAFAAEADSKRVSLLSGFSPALFKAFMGGPEELEQFREATPYETLRKLLDDERYNPVREIVRKTLSPVQETAEGEAAENVEETAEPGTSQPSAKEHNDAVDEKMEVEVQGEMKSELEQDLDELECVDEGQGEDDWERV